MLSYCEIKGIKDGTIKVDAEYLLSLNITVELVPLAYEVKGMTSPCGTWYMIKINSTIPDNQKWEAFLHELVHIVRNDCFDDKPAALAEVENPY